MTGRFAGGHVDVESIAERLEQFDAVVTVHAQIGEDRRVRGNSLFPDAELLGQELDDAVGQVLGHRRRTFVGGPSRRLVNTKPHLSAFPVDLD